jgi:hypothetical protein
MFGLLTKNVMSSAYSAAETPGVEGISLIIMLNNVGESIAPWGTPDLIGLQEEYSPSKNTLNILPLR